MMMVKQLYGLYRNKGLQNGFPCRIAGPCTRDFAGFSESLNDKTIKQRLKLFKPLMKHAILPTIVNFDVTKLVFIYLPASWGIR